MVRAIMLAMLLLAAGLAGCIGDEDVDATNTTVPETSQPPAPAQEGNLVGTVVDPTQVPIPGAEIFMLRNDTMGTTVAQDGSYTMEGVPPGEHLIRAQADGFEGETFNVRIKSGRTTQLDVTLDPETTREAFHETRELGGLLDCAIVVAQAENPERPPCINIDPNARSTFTLEVPPEPARILLEVQWEANQPLAENLYIEAQTIGTGVQDVALGDTEGPSVLRLNIPGPNLERHYADGGKFRINITAATSMGDEEGVAVGAHIEQPFTLFVTTFFVDPGPSEFSALE